MSHLAHAVHLAHLRSGCCASREKCICHLVRFADLVNLCDLVQVVLRPLFTTPSETLQILKPLYLTMDFGLTQMLKVPVLTWCPCACHMMSIDFLLQQLKLDLTRLFRLSCRYV